MKYFTDELWKKINSEDPLEREQADLAWDENCRLYEEIFETIKDRLTKKFLSTYRENHRFHDFRLKELKILHREYFKGNPVSVIIEVTNKFDFWQLRYKGVSKISIDHAVEKNSLDMGKGFDDWGYDEFTIVDEDILSHEILFASGATIQIHFINKGLSIVNVTNTFD